MFLLPVAHQSLGRFLHMPSESLCRCPVLGWVLGGLVFWMRLYMGTCQPLLCQGLGAVPASGRSGTWTPLGAAVHDLPQDQPCSFPSRLS